MSKHKFPRVMRVCQNCIYADNEKGQMWQDGWNIWCNNKTRFYRWDKRKLCYTSPLMEQADE